MKFNSKTTMMSATLVKCNEESNQLEEGPMVIELQ